MSMGALVVVAVFLWPPAWWFLSRWGVRDPLADKIGALGAALVYVGALIGVEGALLFASSMFGAGREAIIAFAFSIMVLMTIRWYEGGDISD